MTKKRTDHDVAFDELSQLTPKPSPDSSKADAIQRVIEAAKDNHGDDCEAWRCLHCGRYCDVTSHRFTPRPCTCGLDAALSLLSVPAQTDDQVIADQTRALLRTTMKSHQDGYAHAKKQIRFLLFRQREWIHADRLNGLLSAIDALESTDGLSPIDEETQIASVSVSPSAAGEEK